MLPARNFVLRTLVKNNFSACHLVRFYSVKKDDDGFDLHKLVSELKVDAAKPDEFAKKLAKPNRRAWKKRTGKVPTEFERAVTDVAEAIGESEKIVQSEIAQRFQEVVTNEREYKKADVAQLLNLLENVAFQPLTSYDKNHYNKPKFTSTYASTEIDLNAGGERLNIFEKRDQVEEVDELMPAWAELEKLSAANASKLPPRNGFEEMIEWTKEGKVYPYPIDNGYLFYENDYKFHQHVFLEPIIEGKIPKEGPVRRFMDLVVNGLSTNPNMSVHKKHEHLQWFVDYFHSKQQTIDQLEAEEKRYA